MNTDLTTTLKSDFRNLIKTHKHDMTAPASQNEFQRDLKALTNQHSKKSQTDLLAALDDVIDVMKKESHNHQNESDADLVLIKRPNGHLHIAKYDEAIKYFVDGYINL